MHTATAKRHASKAGLELYFDRQWQSWGLIDPDCRAEGIWFSSADLRDLTPAQFSIHYIGAMQDRINPDAGGPIPLA